MRGGRNFPPNEMITLVTLPLNVKEYKRLELFAKAHDMSEQQILIQGLRLYDAVDSGDAELIFKKDENFMSEDMIESAVEQMQAQFEESDDKTYFTDDDGVDHEGPPKYVTLGGVRYVLDDPKWR